jgi:fibronectin type 3 domain-containing protein
MKYIFLKSIAVLFSLFLALQAFPQDGKGKAQPFTANLRLTARVYTDSVVLRWAPDAPGAWITANEYGYVLERTIVPDSGNFDPAAYRQLNDTLIKPWPLDDWAKIAGEKADNPVASVAAQALYGESFSGSGTNFVEAADEFANRWSFSILAADMNTVTATALGLRFVDRTYQKGKTYIYRVSCPVDTSVYKIETGYAVVNTSDIVEIPKPFISSAVEMENVIQLEWDREYHDRAFSAYWIERSENKGKTYHRINQVPFIHPQNELRKPSNLILFTDSVPQNYKPYWYRITGITSFGELSRPSDPIMAMGRDKTPPEPPENLKATSLGGSRIRLTWEKETQEKDLQGFLIGRSHSSIKDFVPLFEKPLPPSTRSWTDENADPSTSNYYVVAAVDTAGNGNVSMIAYGMIIDSIPPAPPVNLEGFIDTSGIVHISWSLGKEADLAGYMVYFANDPSHVFSSTTKAPFRDTVFTDTIQLKTLTKKIYYRIKAVDVTYNYSDFSDILELKRPDVVPPTSPVISGYKVTDTGIQLEWIPSMSNDVDHHILSRRVDDGQWTDYRSFPVSSGEHSFTDTSVVAGSDYSYRLQAVDESGLSSNLSMEFTLKFTGNPVMVAVSNVFASITQDQRSILVNWNYPVEGNYRYVVYRAVNGGNFQTVASVEPPVNSYTDKRIRKGSVYEYQVRAFYHDGKKSALGGVAKISVPEGSVTQ